VVTSAVVRPGDKKTARAQVPELFGPPAIDIPYLSSTSVHSLSSIACSSSFSEPPTHTLHSFACCVDGAIRLILWESSCCARPGTIKLGMFCYALPFHLTRVLLFFLFFSFSFLSLPCTNSWESNRSTLTQARPIRDKLVRNLRTFGVWLSRRFAAWANRKLRISSPLPKNRYHCSATQKQRTRYDRRAWGRSPRGNKLRAVFAVPLPGVGALCACQSVLPVCVYVQYQYSVQSSLYRTSLPPCPSPYLPCLTRLLSLPLPLPMLYLPGLA
jgi:hypothetical protein